MIVVRVDGLLVEGCGEMFAMVDGKKVPFGDVIKLVGNGETLELKTPWATVVLVVDDKVTCGGETQTLPELFNTISLEQKGTIQLVLPDTLEEVTKLFTKIDTRWPSYEIVELRNESFSKTPITFSKEEGNRMVNGIVYGTQPGKMRTPNFAKLAINVFLTHCDRVIVEDVAVSNTRGVLLKVGWSQEFVAFDHLRGVTPRCLRFFREDHDVPFYSGWDPITFMNKYCRVELDWQGVRAEPVFVFSYFMGSGRRIITMTQNIKMRVVDGPKVHVWTLRQFLPKPAEECEDADFSKAIGLIERARESPSDDEIVEEVLVEEGNEVVTGLFAIRGIYFHKKRGPIVVRNLDQIPFREFINACVEATRELADDTTEVLKMSLHVGTSIVDVCLMDCVADGNNTPRPMCDILNQIWMDMSMFDVKTKGIDPEDVIPNARWTFCDVANVHHLAADYQQRAIVLKEVDNNRWDNKENSNVIRKEFDVLMHVERIRFYNAKDARTHQAFAVSTDWNNYMFMDLDKIKKMVE